MTLPLPHEEYPDKKIRENFEEIQRQWPQPASAWTSYTATVASTSVTLGTGGSNTARYQKTGRTVHVAGLITLGTGGVFTGSACTIALPFAAGALGQIGSAAASDNSTGFVHMGVCVVNASASTVFFRFDSGTNTPLGATSPFTWADSDALYWQITYEAAV